MPNEKIYTDPKQISSELSMLFWMSSPPKEPIDKLVVITSSFRDPGGDYTTARGYKDNNLVFNRTFSGY